MDSVGLSDAVLSLSDGRTISANRGDVLTGITMPNGNTSITIKLPYSDDYLPSVSVLDVSTGLTLPYFTDWTFTDDEWTATQNVSVATGKELTISCYDLDGRLICTYNVIIGD